MRDITPHPPKQVHSTLTGALARFYWMLGGNAALSLTAIGIAQQGPECTWVADFTFWAVAASLVLVRYLDIALLGGTTASGDPASVGAWYGYSWRLLLVASAVWIIAHAIRWALDLTHARSLASCSCD
jgi:hypothetical protein